MKTSFDEILDILDKWQFILGQRAGRELWMDKPTDIQEEDLANFNRDLEKVRSFIMARDICTCDECKFLKIKEDLFICSKNGIVIFDEFGPNLKEHFCAFGERKEEDSDE